MTTVREKVELLHRVYGAIDVARRMISMSSTLYELRLGVPGADIAPALDDARSALDAVAESITEALCDADRSAA